MEPAPRDPHCPAAQREDPSGPGPGICRIHVISRAAPGAEQLPAAPQCEELLDQDVGREKKHLVFGTWHLASKRNRETRKHRHRRLPCDFSPLRASSEKPRTIAPVKLSRSDD